PNKKPSASSTSGTVTPNAGRSVTSTPSIASLVAPSRTASSSEWVGGDGVWWIINKRCTPGSCVEACIQPSHRVRPRRLGVGPPAVGGSDDRYRGRSTLMSKFGAMSFMSHAGRLLVATAAIGDHNFERTVIL